MRQVISFEGGVTIEINERGYSIIQPDGRRENFDTLGRRVERKKDTRIHYLKDFANGGAYVEYFPTIAEAVVSGFDTGIKEQFFYPSKVRLWRVFKNEENALEIISDKGMELAVKGRDGYSNLGKTLLTIGSMFVNPKYARYGRAFGTTTQTKGKVPVPITWNQVLKENVSIKDEEYRFDVAQMKKYNLGLDNPDVSVWTASRVKAIDKTRAFFGAETVRADGTVEHKFLYGISMERNEANLAVHEVRPIIGLELDVKILGGKGTKDNPYKITK